MNSQIPWGWGGLQTWPWVLFEAQDGHSGALALGVSRAELLLAQPRDLQLFKERSHQVEKQ